jgi:predicted Zn finger-like uncharacterized protein|tara:strand:+ start:88 stop:612 length:525 start_codon:yes stop_codon:yes gene_type:complete
MIITCNNCDKKFDVDSSLIPEKGRLLECNGCNHKWFFNKETIIAPIVPVKNIILTEEEQKPDEVETSPVKIGAAKIENYETIELLDSQIKSVSSVYKNFTKDKIKHKKDIKNNVKKNYSILALTLVFIISFIGLVIIADTFMKPIAEIFPNIEYMLYNLYESITDIILFFKDLT